MYKRRKERQKKIIIGSIIIGVIILFILINIFFPNSFRSVGKFGKDTFVSLGNVITKPFIKLKNKVNDSNRSDEYYNDINSKLSDYELIKNENNELKHENEELKKQLKNNSSLTSKTIINATVVNRNLEYWYSSLTIDKGENDGVKNEMAVLYNGYLIGKVSETGNSNSSIRLLTSDSLTNKLSVKIKVSDDKYVFGLLVGYKDGVYRVEGISDMDKIPTDAEVLTTGLSNNIPSGLLIGKVKEVTTDNYDLAPIVTVSKGINTDDITYVTIVGKE